MEKEKPYLSISESTTKSRPTYGSYDGFFEVAKNETPKTSINQIIEGIQNETIEGRWQGLFDIPEIQDFQDIQTLIQGIDAMNNREASPEDLTKETITKDILLAAELAQDYIQNQPRQRSEHIMKANFRGLNDFLRFYRQQSKTAKSNSDHKMYFLIFIKKMMTFLEIIRSGKFDIDYKNKKINLKNETLIGNITEIFNNEPFKYQSESHKLGDDFDYAEGKAIIDGREFGFTGNFGLKSVERLIGKMARDPKYGTIDAVKDIHRMRIEVEKPNDAIRIAKILFEKLGNNLIAENKGSLISEELLEEYGDSYLTQSQAYYDALIGGSTNSKSKSISTDRKELKLSRDNRDGNGIEIQIVLADNKNEDGGYAHHTIYEMKGFIQEIITDKGYITQKHIQDIIQYYIEKDKEKNNGKSSIPKNITEELIFEHIMSIGLLKEIVEDSKNGSNRRNDNRKFTTQKVLSRFQKNYPDRAKNIQAQDPGINNSIGNTQERANHVLKK